MRRPSSQAKSRLEFHLRLQEFIELVRGDLRLQAVQYARQYLAPWAGQYMQVWRLSGELLAKACKRTN